ncbi:hypothetical protein EDEG_04058 [Edhazardia aedis USNM 41457]|uniref:DNA mismatch repair proteins mutS family domain-containing protein n=1 Tax=Edhazardia aedis (strain USNM 41457) TaxID=1003232 RepID=J9D0V8_EDHAE|nr:hypothetical protein EDEG_04058 [Edhazardia aedis USNM 41457]|eukprot:EJW01209.1 hypothetical protein EDEG_04058 [Edhazardia aedis USNM 41457]
MDTIQRIQSQIPENTIQIFKKQEIYTINQKIQELYEFVGQSNQTASLKLNQDLYEKIVLYILFTLKMCINEYEITGEENNIYELKKTASPLNYSDYSDLIYAESNLNIVASVSLLKANEISFSFYCPISNALFFCDFVDDDIFSNLYGLLSEINCTEIVYDSERLQKMVLHTGLKSQMVTSLKKPNLSFIFNVVKKQKEIFDANKQQKDISGVTLNTKNISKEYQTDCKTFLYQKSILSNVSSGPDISFRDQFFNNAEFNIDFDQNINKESFKSLSLLLSHLRIDEKSFETFNILILPYKMNSCLKIDVNTLEMLNIIGKNGLIEKYLKTYTIQGKRLLERFVRQPSINKTAIENRLNIVEYLFGCPELCRILSKFTDLMKYTRRIMKLSINDVIVIYKNIINIEDLIRILNKGLTNNMRSFIRETNQNDSEIINRNQYNSCSNISSHDILSNTENRTQYLFNFVANDIIYPLINLKEIFEQICAEISRNIDLETSTLNIDISDELINSKQNYLNLVQQEHERLLEINKKIKLEEKDGIFSFRIPRSEYKSIKKHFFVEKNMLKSGVIFTSKFLEDYNSQLLEINQKIAFETRVVMENLLVFMNNFTTQFEAFNYIVALIDVYYTFSKLKDLGFNRPIFSENTNQQFYYSTSQVKEQKQNTNFNNDSVDISTSITLSNSVFDEDFEAGHLSKKIKNAEENLEKIPSVLKIENCFHPLIKNCVRNTLSLESKKFCIITGPNMGGKSTFLKTISTTCILAQIGCLVPCSHAILPILDGIYIRLGCNDNASKGLSTFMVEMIDIARISNNCTNRSLVIIDELGRGTSAIDGLSLALSMRDFLVEKGCITLFATHFSEICKINSGEVINKKVKCEMDDELTLLYEIVDGVCDISYGVNVAEKVGFPKDVVDDARKLNNEYENYVK